MFKSNSRFYFFALAAQGTGLSGGDRIFIELSRRWSKKFPVNLYIWKEGSDMIRSQNLKVSTQSNQQNNTLSGIHAKEVSVPKLIENYPLLNYFYRIFEGVSLGFNLKLKNNSDVYIYNASEFWMDSLPCFILKLRYPKVKWIASWYQTAPNPLKGFAEGDRKKVYRIKAFQYWLMQLPIKYLISNFADKVIVNNEDERKRFPSHQRQGNVIVLIGAVPLSDIKNWQESNKKIKKYFDAVFQGRFHPQKGVLELIDIWKKVVDKIPNAKLGMIGDGPLMDDVKEKIAYYKLNKNIDLLGYVFDGNIKYKLFASGKLVVHPALYDSGGMASAEAMAFGLPCISFNLKAYESYYPEGMIKVKVGDNKAFANAVLDLLSNDTKRKKVGNEARLMIEKNYSWDYRAKEILNKIYK